MELDTRHGFTTFGFEFAGQLATATESALQLLEGGLVKREGFELVKDTTATVFVGEVLLNFRNEVIRL